MQPALAGKREPGDWIEFISTNNLPAPAIGRFVETSIGVAGVVMGFYRKPNKAWKFLVYCPIREEEVEVDLSEIAKSTVVNGPSPPALVAP